MKHIVALYVRLCGKMVPPITMLLTVRRFSSLAILDFVFQLMSLHDVFTPGVICLELCVEDVQVSSRTFLCNELKYVIELIFATLVVTNGERIVLDDVHCNSPLFTLKNALMIPEP